MNMLTGYRTVLLGAVVTVVGALQGLDWVALLPNSPQVAGWVVSGIGVTMTVLRFITSTPIGTK
jgi:hypothetical protein